MVGYRRHDSMTQTQKLIAGCMSGVTTRFIVQPMDVVKLRAQLQKKPKRRSVVYRTARRIFLEEGLAAFWHGHMLGQMHSILAVSSQFYVYELTTQFTSQRFNIPKKYRPVQHFVCGMAAGCVCTMLVIPLEVIRVRQMLVKDQYKSIWKGARAVYRYGGIFAFYEGLSASLLQMGPQVGISFAVFTFCQPLLLKYFFECPPDQCNAKIGNNYKPQSLVIASSIAGSAAGFVSKSMTYPFDLAKRRLQIGSHKVNFSKYKTPSQSRSLTRCKKLTECLWRAYKHEGMKGLFRGWTVTVYKAQLTSVVAFTSYEMICYTLREISN
ncbi:mitochondrial thiamine pyrophosphate carrier-like [Trichoplusia ni]|uniref:Mitochondrial thiamine pyrophosphate carrier-like n=1 Tax=Trichoplusia ni TaxID=7111 RepID=A0A7E5WWL8_TRINI|nr:mitochondrial thiamine pyrophosphate carrier-like [Trichoplusia ni]